jgi:predicted PurR-regulated permease PerM
MTKSTTVPSWQFALFILTGTVVGVVMVACLYWAREVLIPVALAVFLTFLLAPLVAILQQRGLGRLTSSLLVVTLAAAVLAGIVWLLSAQVTGLIGEMPNYTENIKNKVSSLRQLARSAITSDLEKMVLEVTGELEQPGGGRKGKDEEKRADSNLASPTAVMVESEFPAWLARMPAMLGSVFATLAGLALVLVLVFFMLLNREDLRNRLIQLVSRGQISVMTKALDDAGRRISRYLLMQLIVNCMVGLAAGFGLLAIGIPYAFLWGFLTAMFRYIPYIGVWISAILSFILSLAIFAGWVQPILVIGLFVAIELIASNFIEPRLYGRSIGVSEVALLVAAALWTVLWGPIGLVLSSPLTVCLVVLGKYVPMLKFLDVLLGDKPPMEAHVTLYQRLLARDQDEALHLILARIKASSPEQIFDDLLVPVLNYMKQDRERGDLTKSDEQFVLQAIREILEDLGEQLRAAADEKAAVRLEDQVKDLAVVRLHVLGCPAQDRVDKLALEILRRLLDPAKWEMEVVSVGSLTVARAAQWGEHAPPLVCIGALPPGGLARTRYLCKKLRSQLPEVKILVGRWGLAGRLEANREQLYNAGADLVAASMLETRKQMNNLLPILAQGHGEATVH